MAEKFYDNKNFKILKINKKTENISMLIIVLCTLLLLVFFLKIKRFYINDKGLFFSAFGAVLISANENGHFANERFKHEITVRIKSC